MQARVYISALASSNGTYKPEVRVDQHLMGDVKIKRQLSKNKWFSGLIRPGKDTFEFNSEESMFDPESNTGSIFASAGADNARVRIEYPTERDGSMYDTVYRGLISSKESSFRESDGTAGWVCRTPDYSLVNATVNPGLVVEGQTPREAIQAIFNDAEISAYLPSSNFSGYFDPVRGDTVIRDEFELLGDEARSAAVLEKMLLALDGIMIYNAHLQRIFITRRGNSRYSAGSTITSAYDVQIEDGSEMVFNSIICETGLPNPNQTYKVESTGSISRWGVRELKLDLSWIRDLQSIDDIARNLLARLANPQRVVELLLDGWQILPRFGDVGAIINVNIAPEVTEGAAQWGDGGRYNDGGRYGKSTRRRIQGLFYIEEIERSLRDDLVRVRLREELGD